MLRVTSVRNDGYAIEGREGDVLGIHRALLCFLIIIIINFSFAWHATFELYSITTIIINRQFTIVL